MKPSRLAALLLLPSLLPGQDSPGRRHYENLCSICHGGDAMGGEFAPPIAFRLRSFDDSQLRTLLQQGLPGRGMPAFPTLTSQEVADLIAFLRSLRPHRETPPVRAVVKTSGGQTVEGLVLSQGFTSLDLKVDGQSVGLFRRSGDAYRRVTSGRDWTTYNGNETGNRYTTLTQINRDNVARLSPNWIFGLPGTSRLETTPVVVGGIMYVTSGNECYALDAGNGSPLWHFQRPRTKGLVGNAAGGFNRGVAWAGGRVFMVTDNAHLLALNRFTGAIEWETVMADWHQNYNATSAPLAVGDLVISGTAGGEQGARGFIAAWRQSDGQEVWRFWTVPKPGEPGSETWRGAAIEHPSAVAWFTGSYDASLDTVYWQTGNPGPDYNGAARLGDNLYSCSILALEARTGQLKWYYQFTPHDVHDWDAAEPALLVDAAWLGRPRKLLLMANRNGFFYVLDRTNGQLLLAKPFVGKLNWAKQIGPDGRPVLNPPEPAGKGGGVKVCPAQDGATNWQATAYDPASRLFFVQALESCSIYSTLPAEWRAGRGYLGGWQRAVPNERPQKVLRAIDISTGKTAWQLPQPTPGFPSFGGVLATSTGLLFFCEESGSFMAVDSSTGHPLWSFPLNQSWRSSPMTYQFDGTQYVAIAGGGSIFAFALPDSRMQ
jgi:alcohol dehydrogenase (cytochrome c)